jgi:dTDP-4-amino-4,6-dideoxygalactose transaminase
MIPVTKPFLPPKEEVHNLLSGIWDRNWLTNNGPLLNEYELNLKEYLDLDHLIVVNNGTIAIQIAIKALGISGEVITTPFSYVATTSSIVWEGCTPVFVDIDEDTFNIDPTKIEASISPETQAILATHCFGNPCDIDTIQAIANKHNLKVIYDAAHCFGTKYKGKSIFEYGDVSTLSLHATKLVHSVEGGAIVTKDPDLLKRMAYMRNFGHDGPEKFNGVGINGKNSEFHAAVGISVLKYADDILASRKSQKQIYDANFENLRVRTQKPTAQSEPNFSYYPIVFESEEALKKALVQLSLNEIYPRRYFYPLLSSLDYVTDTELPVASKVSTNVLCLPMYLKLSKEEQDLIGRVLLRSQNYG